MISPLHFQIAGALLILLALSHAWMPSRLGWREDTASMSALNRQIFHVHSFFIAFAVLMNGILFVGWADLLLRPDPLRNLVLLGIGSFWLLRLVTQLFVYDRCSWQGDAFRTGVHLSLTCLWTYLAATSFGTVLMNP